MLELTLTPAHGLHQSVDYPLQVTYPADRAIQPTHTARMELRYALDDPEPVDILTTENGRLVLNASGDGSANVWMTSAWSDGAHWADVWASSTCVQRDGLTPERIGQLFPAESPGLRRMHTAQP